MERMRAGIGEMMLAKTVLEEKNELLENKERAIADLRLREKHLQQDLVELKSELREVRERALQEGIQRVVTEVIPLVCAYDDGKDSIDRSLARRLIQVFQERYALETIEGDCGKLDPERHQVIEVVHCPGEGFFIEVRDKGFRLNGKLIRPALVRVFQGTKDRS